MPRFVQRTALLLSLLSASLLANATPITFNPAFQTVDLGDQVQIDIFIDPDAGTFIGGFDLVVNFDAGILSVFDVVFGESLTDPLDPFSSIQDSGANGFGSIFISELSFLGFFDLQDGYSPFLLASVFFDTIGVGLSNIFLTDIILSDDFGDALDPTASDADINVTEAPIAVPEPATWTLLVIGLMAVWLRRRKSV